MTSLSEPLASTIDPEDQARADFYALLSRLYRAAPDADLLRAIASADPLPVEEGSSGHDLAQSWRTLMAASRAMDPEAASDEYQELFIGVGKSEVSLYASSYMKAPAGSELADVRAALARLGLSRQPRVNVFEDHLALMCETMRTLIAGTRESLPADLVVQKKFFHDHIEPWVFECCDAIKMHPIANYYRRVAEFTDRFMAIERDSYAIE